MERGASQEDDRDQDAERRRDRRDEREDSSGRTGGHRGGYSGREAMGSGSLASLLSKPDVLAAVSMITQISQGGGIGFGQVSKFFLLTSVTVMQISTTFYNEGFPTMTKRPTTKYEKNHP